LAAGWFERTFCRVHGIGRAASIEREAFLQQRRAGDFFGDDLAKALDRGRAEEIAAVASQKESDEVDSLFLIFVGRAQRISPSPLHYFNQNVNDLTRA